MQHSILPPSSSDTWVKCAMWVTMAQMYPQEDSEDKKMGIAAHWAWEQQLKGNSPKLNDTAPNGIVINEEMIDGSNLFIDTIDKFDLPRKHLHIEERVDIHDVHPLCFGTPDIWHFNVSTQILDILDYKFGHRFVEEYENSQCVLYTRGIVDRLSVILGIPPGILDQQVKVRITIVQPRCYSKGSSVRTWEFVASNIRGLINIAHMSAEEALGSNPKAKVNPGCSYCPGRHSCQTLQRDAYNSASIATSSLPLELSIEAASLELKMLQSSLALLDARVSGLTEYITNKIKNGENAPFHSAGSTKGRRIWSLPKEEIIALGKCFNVELSSTDVITPAQALKLGVDESVINCYSEIKPGSFKLEQENPVNVSKIFGVK